MTLIMWGIYPHEGIEVYTDTQMTTTSGEVVGETNKYFATPANVVIAGTGGADTIEAWQSLSATTQLDLDQLVLEAEQQLPSIHDSIVGNAGIASTAFHFGWSSAHGQFAGAVQSSDCDLASEFARMSRTCSPQRTMRGSWPLPAKCKPSRTCSPTAIRTKFRSVDTS